MKPKKRITRVVMGCLCIAAIVSAVGQISTSVRLCWDASPSRGVDGYCVYQVGTNGVATKIGSTTNCWLYVSIPTGPVTYGVTASNWSGESALATLSTNGRPYAPTGLTLEPLKTAQ